MVRSVRYFVPVPRVFSDHGGLSSMVFLELIRQGVMLTWVPVDSHDHDNS
jgi:hypothetical protein